MEKIAGKQTNIKTGAQIGVLVREADRLFKTVEHLGRLNAEQFGLIAALKRRLASLTGETDSAIGSSESVIECTVEIKMRSVRERSQNASAS